MLRGHHPEEKEGLLTVDTDLKDPEDQSPIRSPTVNKAVALQNEVYHSPGLSRAEPTVIVFDRTNSAEVTFSWRC